MNEERSPATVVITTRNRRALLEQAVESILTQIPVPPLVVVDDASSDDTAAWLAGSHAGGPEVVRLDERAGLPGARNAGLTRVRTPYVLFLDDDDALVRGALHGLSGVLDRRPGAVAAVGGRLRFSSDGATTAVPIARREFERLIHREVLLGWVAMSGQTLFRRSSLVGAGSWNAVYDAVAEDQELWLRLTTLGPVAFHPRPVVWNRSHAGQSRPVDVRQVEDEMRELHVSLGSPPCRAAVDRRVLAARRSQLLAFEHYVQDRPWRAIPPFVDQVVSAPWILTSPLTRSGAWGFFGRSLAAGVVGRRSLVRVGELLRSARGAQSRKEGSG